MSNFLHRSGVMMFQGRTKAFPVLRSTSNDAPGDFDSDHTADLPAGVQAGDLLVMFCVARATGAGLTDVTATGWTRLGTSPTLSAQAFYRIAPSAITTVQVLTPGAATGLTTNIYCFSGYTLLPEIQWTNGTGEFPDPAELTVPSEWRNNPHCTFISSLHLFGNVEAIATPSSYSNLISSLSSNNNRTYSVRRNLQAESDNPGTWEIDGTNPDIQSWTCATVAIRGTE